LVSVDVNSARSTRGGDIETTALNTNLEAAEEVARQLRLRDLGGLIVIDFIDMENAKNQREVETRLKDALRYDRARVQMGKISRFGLMELSRQRLRPSLSEGSHVTCPRCNGTGHIRDTESSALQVLRIIQEEAMKENSAAIHVQVPVDVAAFLLNEKRGEILKIETRHRVTVILIPNTHLETPHYKLDRLKHDDPRLEEHHASYAMAEQVDTDIGYSKRQKEDVKPRQEAMVKSITPETAPIVERKETPAPVVSAPAPAAGPGFFAKLMSFFFGKSEESTTKVATPVVTEEKSADRDRNGRNGRNQRNNQRNRNRSNRDRDEREDRPVAASTEKSEAAKAPLTETPRPPKTAKQVREPREPKEPQEGRRERQQRQREERKEALLAEAKPEDLIQKHQDPVPVEVMPAQAPLQNLEQGVDENAEQSEERRRRRRRGGRNRNRREREPGEMNEQGELAIESGSASAVEIVATNEAAHEAPAEQVIPAVTQAPALISATPATVAVVASTAPEPAESHIAPVTAVFEPVAAMTPAPVMVASNSASETTLSVTQTETVASIATKAEPSALLETHAPVTNNVAPAMTVAPIAEVIASPVVTAPVAIEAAAPIAPPVVVAPATNIAKPVVTSAPMPLEQLHGMLSAAGLQLASTDPEKLRAAQESASKIAPAPRVPRERKPLPPVSTEPLVLVETRR